MNKAQIKIGISSKKYGAMKKNKQIQQENVNEFLRQFQIDPESLVLMHQIHSGNSKFLSSRTRKVGDADGIVTNKKNLFLGVMTADCVPLLLFDRDHHVIAAVHAGYKGILSGIVESTLDTMEENGAYPSHIEAILGPAIGVCCYDVDEVRAHSFRDKFGSSVVEMRDSKQYVNLSEAVMNILKSRKVLAHNIFFSDICTKDHHDEYFSYRFENKDTYGEFMSVIGIE